MPNLMSISKATSLFTLIFAASLSFAHGGSVKKSGPFKGCHNNSTLGVFECHEDSAYNGRSWKNIQEAEREITTGGSVPTVPGPTSPTQTSTMPASPAPEIPRLPQAIPDASNTSAAKDSAVPPKPAGPVANQPTWWQRMFGVKYSNRAPTPTAIPDLPRGNVGLPPALPRPTHAPTPQQPSQPAPANDNVATPYDRGQWGGFKDLDGDCRDTRVEVLLRENRGPKTFSEDGCSLRYGSWKDFYTGDELNSASDIQIDHVVALKEAHISGGANWSPRKKQKFANDPDNLVVTSVRTNTGKGANNFTTWIPRDREIACEYAQRWFKVKQKYELTYTKAEVDTLRYLKCKVNIDLLFN